MERAVEMAAALLPPPEPRHLRSAMIAAQQEANRVGITGIHDVGDRHSQAVFEGMAESGELTLRVLFHPPVSMLPQLIASGVKSGDGTPMLRTGGIKLFLDGSLGSQTAWMLEPYQGSRDRGMPLSSIADAERVMRAAVDGGLALTVHAIGDAAVRRALDLMEPLPRVAIPHRIEHLQCVHPADLERSARAGIVASMQPAHILVDIPLAERYWGARSAGAYAFRTLERMGTVVAFGSDVPVASLDPREGMYAALARTGLDGTPLGGWYPEQRLDFVAAVNAYTVAPARAAGVVDRRGSLFPGADADFVAWDVDPLAEQGSGDAFRAGRCRLTVVDGRIAWSDLQ
jgi:predicted amidohydrolase YtcJ